jgi:hypothetical protein
MGSRKLSVLETKGLGRNLQTTNTVSAVSVQEYQKSTPLKYAENVTRKIIKLLSQLECTGSFEMGTANQASTTRKSRKSEGHTQSNRLNHLD